MEVKAELLSSLAATATLRLGRVDADRPSLETFCRG